MAFGQVSMAERLATLPPRERAEVIASISPEEWEALEEDWEGFWARPNQRFPGESCECGCEGRWLVWLILAGRGWGKTRTGAEWVHHQVNSGTYGRYHLVGATAGDVRDIMVEGPTGIMKTAKRHNLVEYSPTKRKVTWQNGAAAILFSADEPERFRGQQAEAAWADELASWRYPESWSQLQLGMRLGAYPRTIVTTTPRPIPLIRRLIKDPRTHVTRGTSWENLPNLADVFVAEITSAYEGTRFGRQELYAEILEDSESALWHRDMLEDLRRRPEEIPALRRIIVAVDPAVQDVKVDQTGQRKLDTRDSRDDEYGVTGIIVAGLGVDGHGYVLHDASGRMMPEAWARKVVALYHEYRADRVVYERNQGGALVARNLSVEDPSVALKDVQASRGKITRAEPVSTLYERGKVHHVGFFDRLEEQMCTFEAGQPNSPDRMDALVWAITELMIGAAQISVSSFVDNELAMAGSPWRIPGSGGGSLRRGDW